MTPADQPVVVVTGGGGGIGAAIAEELGRTGHLVVTMDPLVSLDGSEQLPTPEETTAGRIVAAGGTARASSVSVTDREGVRGLFEELVSDHGRLDGVINVAGISRPTTFATGTDADWLDVLAVHLDGYLNILAAALPIMSAAGRGQILGVTSGSGWRPADTGAYGCAKRAVASLTWQLGRNAPPGVVVNAMSPIAMTRMVTAALGKAPRQAAGGSGPAATGGLSLGSMPTPEQLGPLGAYLVSEDFAWCTGQVVFVGGSEAAVLEPPRLLEVARTDDAASLAHVLEAVTAGALAPAEARQASTGGSNPRFGAIFAEPAEADLPESMVRTCAVASDRPELAAAVIAALEARGVTCARVPVDDRVRGFDATTTALSATADGVGPLDAVVVALAGRRATSGSTTGWEQVLAEHAGIVEQIHADAGWARAVADHALGVDRPVRLVSLTDATTAGGRSRAQASAQHARAARKSTGERVSAYAVGIETPEVGAVGAHAEIVAHLLCSPASSALAGAELVAGAGWFGLRSHPRPGASIVFGGPGLPTWFDGAMRDIVGTTAARVGEGRRGSREENR